MRVMQMQIMIMFGQLQVCWLVNIWGNFEKLRLKGHIHDQLSCNTNDNILTMIDTIYSFKL